MLKEYTLKVTVRVGGDSEQECYEKLCAHYSGCDDLWEITHEQEVEPEVERD